MSYTNFVRKPFVVEAVEVTDENIAELAPSIGALVVNEDGTKEILVDRRLVPAVRVVRPGFMVTKMGRNVRCFAPKVFKEQFVAASDEVLGWVAYLNQDEETDESPAGE